MKPPRWPLQARDSASLHRVNRTERTLVIMVKEPVAGRVKTRLAGGIGTVAATAVYRHTTAAVLSRVVAPRQWRTVLAVAPDARRHTPAFPNAVARMAQGPGDLGQRMQRIMDRLPRGPVLIIGSDIPGICAHHIRDGFKALSGHDAVFGPTPDGGYWMVGLKRRRGVPRAFAGVRWSTAHALADTRANLSSLHIAECQTLEDIDDADGLARFLGRHGRRII